MKTLIVKAGQTLIVPDLHERIPELRRLLDYYLPRVDHVVFLGDYFDSFTRTRESTEQTIEWLRDALDNPRYTLLMGNHDLHYLWPGHRCSGYHEDTARLVKAHFTLSDLRQRLQLYANVEGWLVTHAGLHARYLPEEGFSWEWLDAQAKKAKADADHGERHWYFACGVQRGGWAKKGGPLWLDWHDEFELDARLPRQIVGHTERGHTLKRLADNYCLDTAWRHCGVVDEQGRLAVHDIKR